MNKIKSLLRIPELRVKILITIALLFVFRLGCAIPVPFINAEVLTGLFETGNTFDYLNMMSGGALSQCAVLALGVTPYINASIIVQLLSVVIPSWEAARKDPDGKKKIEMYTKLLFAFLSVVLSVGYLAVLNRYGALAYTEGFAKAFSGLVIVSCFVAGAQFVLWLGKKIDTAGIGNGVSLLIFAGIVARWSDFSAIIKNAVQGIQTGNWLAAGMFVLSIVLLLLSIWFVVYVSGSERRIPIQYAGRVVGRSHYRSMGSFIPLKLMMSGVMPVIFASTVLSLPQTVALFINAEKHPDLVRNLMSFNSTSAVWCVLYVAFIFFFNYFYVSIQYDAVEMANNLRMNGGTIPGRRPGKPTSEFISKAMRQIAGTGSVALALIAIAPIFAQSIAGIYMPLSGTSLLIVVGVATELVTTLDSYALVRNHKGFLA